MAARDCLQVAGATARTRHSNRLRGDDVADVAAVVMGAEDSFP